MFHGYTSTTSQDRARWQLMRKRARRIAKARTAAQNKTTKGKGG